MSRSPSRLWLFRGIAIAIPLLFFALVEAALRLAGYGDSYPLFMPNPQAPDYLTPRPDVVKRYFADAGSAPSVTIETNFFLREKPAGGLRLFVLGGSTAAGFPFGYGASIAGMLDYRLKQSFPDRPVEVVNASLSAVNSYTVLDFSNEVLEQDPDAVLIYAGHNEYLGILGVGSAYSAAGSQALTRLYLALKDLRLLQLMQRSYAGLTSSAAPAEENTRSRTFMARVARHKNIPHGSALFERGLEQFEDNLSRIIERYRVAGIPVFLATIASNLADQPPFVSASIPEGDMAGLRPVLRRIDSGGALSENDIALVTRAAERYRSADAYFALGRYYRQRGDAAAALAAYTQARDHDLLRFRAPSEINPLIRELAAAPGVILVDANAALERASRDGIVGANLMLEHLHPNLDGYFLIADAFYRRIVSSGEFGTPPRSIGTAAARRELPVLDAEEYWGRAKIAALMADYPFTDAPTTPRLPERRSWSDELGYDFYRKEIGWLELANETFRRSKDQPLLRLKSAKIIADAVPHRADLSFQAGVVLIENGRAWEAPRYLQRAIRIDPDNVNYRLALSHALIEQRRFRDAIPWIESVLELDPDNRTALEVQRQYRRAGQRPGQ